MERPCDVCGTAYEAKRKTSRYCSTRCRTRASRAGGVKVVDLPTVPPESPPGLGSVAAATLAALEMAERANTPMGQASLALARRLDEPGADTGSAMAAVAKQLEAMLASATKGAASASSPDQLRDELAARRQKHA